MTAALLLSLLIFNWKCLILGVFCLESDRLLMEYVGGLESTPNLPLILELCRLS